MLTIACIRCPSTTPVKELDEDSGFAVCRRCGAVFEIPAVHLREAREDHPWLRPPRQLPTPPSYAVSMTDVSPKDYRGHVKRELAMSWPVDDVRIMPWMFLFLASVLWTACIVGFSRALQSSGSGAGILLAATAFGTLLPLILTYLLLVGFLGRVHLKVESSTLQIRHVPPNPWSSRIALQTEDIAQLFCSRHRGGRRGEVVYFSLNAVLRTGKVLPLVPRMRSSMKAMFLQQRLREDLDLPQQP